MSSTMKDGKRYDIPTNMHPPIEQAAIMLKGAKNKTAARLFLDFAKTDVARATLTKYGFSSPPDKATATKKTTE